MFDNRQQAGMLLARKLNTLPKKETAVYGITRGGLVVAYFVSSTLKLPLYPLVVKKIGAPYEPELALGAVTYQKTSYLDNSLIQKLRIPSSYLSGEIRKKYAEVKTLCKKYTIGKLRGEERKVVLIDDGIATGATIRACLHLFKRYKIDKIVIAVPVVDKSIYKGLKLEVEEIIALVVSPHLCSVGEFYRSFPQVSDEEVIDILQKRLTQ